MKHPYRRIFCMFLMAMALVPAVFAGEMTLEPEEVYCFQSTDLAAENARGVMVTAVPRKELGEVKLGSRTICAGDVLTAENLENLCFFPAGQASGDGTLSCLSVSEEGLGEHMEMTLRIGSGKNQPPQVEDSEFETYKNIPGQIRLKATDPEEDPLTVTVVQEPKRGSLEITDDGTVTYTPNENKVGKDSFTYTVTDSAGNVSPEATVRITIRKPSEKETYGDMEGDEGLLAATWLREMGVYTGEKISGHLLFQPEEAVTRGDFIAMCIGLTSSGEELETMGTGFADEAEIPDWLSPYVAQAVKCGYISGVPTGQGLKLLPGEPICRGEAAVIVTNLLGLPLESSQQVMAQFESVPAWAAPSVSAAMEAGVFDGSDSQMVLTRRDAAMLLYDTWQQANENGENNSLLAWAMK